MCIILADGECRSGTEINILQVIEALAYDASRRQVSILLDVMVDSKRDRTTSILVAHRGHVTATLPGSNLATERLAGGPPSQLSDPASRETVLGHLYRDRVVMDPSGGIMFHQRRNCFSLDPEPTPIHNVRQGELKLESLLVDHERHLLGASPPFSLFEIPAIKTGVSWFRLALCLSGASYTALVENQRHFWVDGPDRVFSQIVQEDIPQRGYVRPDAASLFWSRVAPHRIAPSAYDIVIFQPGTQECDRRVRSVPITGDVYEALIDDELARRLAQLFVTRSLGFWIDLSFEDDRQRVSEVPPRVSPCSQATAV